MGFPRPQDAHLCYNATIMTPHTHISNRNWFMYTGYDMELCSRVPHFKKYSMNILNLPPFTNLMVKSFTPKHSVEIGGMKFSESRVERLLK